MTTVVVVPSATALAVAASAAAFAAVASAAALAAAALAAAVAVVVVVVTDVTTTEVSSPPLPVPPPPLLAGFVTVTDTRPLVVVPRSILFTLKTEERAAVPFKVTGPFVPASFTPKSFSKDRLAPAVPVRFDDRNTVPPNLSVNPLQVNGLSMFSSVQAFNLTDPVLVNCTVFTASSFVLLKTKGPFEEVNSPPSQAILSALILVVPASTSTAEFQLNLVFAVRLKL